MDHLPAVGSVLFSFLRGEDQLALMRALPAFLKFRHLVTELAITICENKASYLRPDLTWLPNLMKLKLICRGPMILDLPHVRPLKKLSIVSEAAVNVRSGHSIFAAAIHLSGTIIIQTSQLRDPWEISIAPASSIYYLANLIGPKVRYLQTLHNLGYKRKFLKCGACSRDEYASAAEFYSYTVINLFYSTLDVEYERSLGYTSCMCILMNL